MRGRSLRLSIAVLKAALAAAMASTKVGDSGLPGGGCIRSAGTDESAPLQRGAVATFSVSLTGLGRSGNSATEVGSTRVFETGTIFRRSVELIIEDDATDDVSVPDASVHAATDLLPVAGSSGTPHLQGRLSLCCV